MVQKPRRARKKKIEATKEVKEVDRVGPSGKTKDPVSGMGSRFRVLGDDFIVADKENEIEIHSFRTDINAISQSEDVPLVEKLDVNQVNKGKRKIRKALLNK